MYFIAFFGAMFVLGIVSVGIGLFWSAVAAIVFTIGFIYLSSKEAAEARAEHLERYGTNLD